MTMIDRYGEEHEYGEAHYEPLGGGPYDGPYWTYSGEFNCEHTDTFMEHVTRCVCIRENGTTFRLNSRDDVLWSHCVDGFDDCWDVDTDLYEMAESLSDAPSVPAEKPDGWGKVVGGWHSSMEPSALSEAIKSITRGEYHDHSVPEGWRFPLIVRYGDTKNCCSQPVSIYAPTEHHEEIESVLDGKHAQPAYAGVS